MIKISTLSYILGAGFTFGPWYFFDNLGVIGYLLCVVGIILMCIGGMGAQMEMLGKGDTGAAFLLEIWQKLKKKIVDDALPRSSTFKKNWADTRACDRSRPR